MKIRTFLLLPAISLFMLTSSYGQGELARNTSNENSSIELTTTMDMAMIPPTFKGGQEALALYMKENLTYPAFEKSNDIEGTVLLEYYINPKGGIENIKVIQSVSEGIDKEAIRLIENMPSWNPAMIQGEQRQVKYRLPITFDLSF